MISPQLAVADQALASEFAGQYRNLGGQVLWVDRNGDGVLEKRTIAGTNILSQHVGGNARDVAPLTQAAEHIAIIDSMVARARQMGCKVLWRGVRNHFPHHAHIEGVPAYSQAELAAFYDDTEEEDMKELIANIQRALIIAGYDLGTFTPLSPEYPAGADGDWGAKTDEAFTKAMIATIEAAKVDHDHDLELDFVPTHTHPVAWPPQTDLVTGPPSS